jgi:transcriptional regulator with XRE-family HTH domain
MRLRKERKRARLTQTALAKLAKVPQGSISKLERGELLAPSFETLDRLARALQRRGRLVSAAQLQPKRQPVLIKGYRNERKGGQRIS